ncbi:MAG: adenylate cyclase [bacterium]|jgi:adenylate cyclase
MAKIVYEHEKTIEEENLDLNLLEIALKNDIPQIYACGGKASCSTCRIVVHEDSLGNVLPRTEKEKKLAEKKGLDDHIRLACQTKIRGDVQVRRLVLDDRDVDMAISEIGRSAGEQKKIAVLFSDIRNFTPFVENNLSYDVVHILNRYFFQMGEAIIQSRGFIDKYMGDGIMAMFGLNCGSPEEACLDAVKAGIQMQENLKFLNQHLQEHFSVQFKIGVGIHFGEVIVGEMGHPDSRQFTAIGDAVNLASRVESMTKKAGTDFLITHDVYEYVKSQIKKGQVFQTSLKGKSGEYRLYEVLGIS